MSKPRVTKRKASDKGSARLLIRCGDCVKKLEIYFDEQFIFNPDSEEDHIEIGGVIASRAEWRTILKRVGL
jgi:hypothetical protein